MKNKPRLLKWGDEWFCGVQAYRSTYCVVAFSSIGKGRTPLEAWENWWDKEMEPKSWHQPNDKKPFWKRWLDLGCPLFL